MAAVDANPFVNPKGGKVIPVESVQELVKNHDHPNAAEAVPPRYIRPQEERPTVSLIGSSEFSIPVIDMKKLIFLQGQEDQRKQEMDMLSDACQEWGFFQIVNHGIPNTLRDDIKAVAKEFFSLPLEQKLKYAPQAGASQGYGKIFVTADDQTLDWGDLLALALMPNSIKNLALWPTVPTHFRDTVERYAIEIERVAQEVLSLFAENLHLEDADYFKNVFGSEPMNMMRMNFYPPCPRPDLVLGLSPHSDGGGITLLLQDDESVGLHVRKNNRWIPVQPIPYGLPNSIKNLALWPTVPTHFRDTVERYAIEIERVAQEVLSLFAENLHLEDADYFKNVFGSEPMNMMRMNFYPPCPRPDLVLGLSPHSDGGEITLLLQDDESIGLHVRKNNRWIPVQPIPYGLVVNIGDLVEVMTNGRYKSVEHRAVTNEERARLSIALFYNASMDAEVAPSSKLVDEHHPCLYRKFIHEEYIRYYISRQLKGKHNLADFAKIDRTNS